MPIQTALEILNDIRPPAPKRRFLQSWDRQSRILRFGCGDEINAVHVGSDGSIDLAGSARSTKLRAATVRRFLEGTTTDSSLADVQKILRDYIHFGDHRIYMLLALWIMGTYVYSIFSHFGYLFLHSQTKRCGKTRAEEVTSHLAFEATTPRNAPTPPSMRETAVEGGTAIFDTLERWKEKGTESYAAAMEILDAGFRNGGTVIKMVPAGNGEWRLESYPVYAPYMFAAINKESLTDTALDRSFVVDMVRKSTKLKTLPYDARCEGVCEPVREKLYLTALTRAAQIAEVYESRELEQRVERLGLNDRAADIWKPVLAITLALGESAIFDELSSLAQELSPDPDRKEERHQLAIVRALRTLAGPGGTVTGTTQQVIGMLREVVGVDCPDLHGVLSSLGLSEKSMRLAGLESPRKAWEISDAELARIEASLAPGDTPSGSATTTTTTLPEGDGAGGGSDQPHDASADGAPAERGAAS